MACRAAICALTLTLIATLPVAAQTLRDPMRPAGAIAKPAPTADPAPKARKAGTSWRLQSTLIGGDRRSAIINGHLVAPGERVHGARVLSIDHDLVVIDAGGRKLQLRPYNPVRKRDPQDNKS